MKKLFKLFLIVSVVFAFSGSVFAQDEAVMDDEGVVEEIVVDETYEEPMEEPMEEAPELAHQKGDAVEFSGVVEVTPADEAAGQKYSTIILKVGEESYKLIPSEAKEAFTGLEAAAGKTINVKGTFLPADDAHPLAAIKVNEWSE